MNMNLKWAVIFSILFHISLLAIRPLAGAGSSATPPPIEIT